MRIEIGAPRDRSAAHRAPTGKAVFVDKDGTLVVDVPYNVDPRRVRFAPHAVAGIGRLAAAGYQIIVVSNQSGVALGKFGLPELETLGRALRHRLARHGVPLHGFHACPHAPDAVGDPTCPCRKPNDGLLREAAREHAVSLERSWMIGDILDDVEAGRRAGCRAVLLNVGHETIWKRGPLRVPTLVATDLDAAAAEILRIDAPVGVAA